MKKFESYKDSGIEWIGKIPEHWDLKRLKRFAQICNGQDQKKVLQENGKYPIYGTGGIFGYADTFLYDKPSVLLGRKGTIDKPQYVNEPFWSVDTAYYTKINSETNPRFFYYLCSTINFDLYKYGSAIPSMTQSQLNDIPFCCPSLSEQNIISKFLDDKCAQIDLLIDKKQKLIELKKEERAAIINQAVTKGLDVNVPMKDSGIEWLGQIPEHWEVKKLKYVLNNFDNIRVPLSSDERGIMKLKAYDYYGASGIIDKVDEFLFDGKYILVGEDGANLLSRSTPLAFIAEGKFWVNNHAHILQPKIGNIDYYVNYLELVDFTILITGAAQPKLTQENLANIIVIVPPINEQNQIADYLKNRLDIFDMLTKKILRQIELLKEYKATLITEAVTGKLNI